MIVRGRADEVRQSARKARGDVSAYSGLVSRCTFARAAQCCCPPGRADLVCPSITAVVERPPLEEIRRSTNRAVDCCRSRRARGPHWRGCPCGTRGRRHSTRPTYVSDPAGLHLIYGGRRHAGLGCDAKAYGCCRCGVSRVAQVDWAEPSGVAVRVAGGSGSVVTNSGCKLLRVHKFQAAGFGMTTRPSQDGDVNGQTLSPLWKLRIERAERAFRRAEAVRQAGGGLKNIGADGAR